MWGPGRGGERMVGVSPRGMPGGEAAGPLAGRLHHPRAEGCLRCSGQMPGEIEKPTCYTSEPVSPHPLHPHAPSPSKESTRVCLSASTRLCCRHRGWGRWGFSGFTRKGSELGRARRAGHASKCRWVVAGTRGCPVSWGCARGGGGASRLRCRAPTSPPGHRPSAVMSHRGPSPLRPQPPPAPRRPRRPSLSPRDKPAGGWGSGAARSQPARREGRGAGRAGGPQPSRGAAVRAPSAAGEQQPLCARSGPAPLPMLMPRRRRQ